MKIFVAGATGALGRRLVPLLIEGGHEVIGTTRTAGKADALRAAGARRVVIDALDQDAVWEAVIQAEPEVVVHQLTALAGFTDLRKLDEGFAATNRLRIEGTDHRLEGIRRLRVRRIVAQSYAGPAPSHGPVGSSRLRTTRSIRIPLPPFGELSRPCGTWSEQPSRPRASRGPFSGTGPSTQGRRRSLLDFFGVGYTVLAGPAGERWLTAVRALATERPVPLRCLGLASAGELRAAAGAWSTTYQVAPDGAALVRPDGLLAWIAPDAHAAEPAALPTVLADMLAW